MKLILQLKHWQLFLVLLVFARLRGGSGGASIIADLIFMFIFLGWIWSIGTHGRKLLSAKRIASKSTVFLAFNITYLCLFCILLNIFQEQTGYQPDFPLAERVLVWLFNGYAVFAGLYATWFAARTLSVLENAGEYSWGTTFVYAFLILFPIIGIWVIQPIVNNWSQKRLYTGEDFDSGDTGILEDRAIQ